MSYKKRGTGINKQFEIISFSKSDLLDLQTTDKEGNIVYVFKKTDVLNLRERDMKRIASKLADDYCEQLFWSSLEIIAEHVISEKNESKM